ncbi:MAG: patatin-like phospholipase family protein [Actinomycetota bacterium]
MQGSGTKHASNRPRVGLVLGGGGILGGAWLVGALHALAEATGWNPSEADYIVGTSAGSVVGALVGEGIPPWFLVYQQRGGDVSGMTDRFGEPLADAEDSSRRFTTWTGQVPRPVLGSPKLVLRTALQPWRYPPMTALTGWIGRGFLSTDEIGRLIRSVSTNGSSSHRNLWIVALDYATGKRVVFGRDGAPRAHLDEAVRASCAIPGLYRPVKIDGRLYVDGGVWSPSNLDLMSHDNVDVDIVVAMNPMSSLQPGLPTTIAERVERRIRSASGRRFGREARRIRAGGTELLMIQPGETDLDAMGINLMDPSRRVEVLERSIETTSKRLGSPDALAAVAALRGSQAATA